jgi:hypothetical protein
MLAAVGQQVQAEKIPFAAPIDQVVDEGYLFMGKESMVLLVGHPDKKLTDGEKVNCYAVKTTATYEYESVDGAKRKIRVYRYVEKRMGKAILDNPKY